MNCSIQLKTLLNVAIVQAHMNRKFDGRLGSLGLTEFLLLYQLLQQPNGTMRRIDLAEQIGLTASGVTRILGPMEKIGLVTKQANSRDARVSLVQITAAGTEAVQNSLENAEALAQSVLQQASDSTVTTTNTVLQQLGGTVV